jgi:hypothetical protein
VYTERKRRRIYLLRKKRKEKKRREQKGLLAAAAAAAAAAAPKSNMLPRSSAGFIYILILASFSIAVIQTRIKIRVSSLLFCLEEEEPARDRDAGAWCD